jgi:Carboxypeptidase regulatory-like domain
MNLMILVICLGFASYLTPTVVVPSRSQTNAIIKGHVYDKQFGLPVPGAKVTILSDRVRQYATSDQGGSYEFKGLNEGQYAIFVQSLGFRDTEQTLQVRKGGQVVSDIPLRIGHLTDTLSIEISGTARLADKTPCSGVNILIISPFDQEIVARTKTDDAGHYAANVDDPGQYVLYAFKSGFEVLAFPFVLQPSLPRKPYTRDIVLSPFSLK